MNVSSCHEYVLDDVDGDETSTAAHTGEVVDFDVVSEFEEVDDS